jgi:hypothetical protein
MIIMTLLTRQETIDVLQKDWGTYVSKFRSLPPEAQSAFLAAQGYVRFADLLAHIVAWWQAGHRSVERYLADPEAQPQHYDVDAFNADAVARAVGLDEHEVVESFETVRVFLIEFVNALPETAFANEKVSQQLSMDLTGHLREHALPEQ